MLESGDDTFPYRITIDSDVFSAFMEDRIGGNVKSCFVVTKQYDSF